MKQEFDCIVCPRSCHLVIETCNDVLSVSGNSCLRGDAFAKQEIVEPMRMFTSTVRIEGALYPLLPVITSKNVPKAKVFDIIRICKSLKVQAPVMAQSVLLKNVAGTDADLLASRTMERRNLKNDE